MGVQDPVPAKPWSGDRDASRHGNVSLQAELSNMIGDEDCLYLNVYARTIEPSKKRAVMVWIHGGGFFAGAGDELFYGPDYIVLKDVVLVTLNYRLGVLGTFVETREQIGRKASIKYRSGIPQRIGRAVYKTGSAFCQQIVHVIITRQNKVFLSVIPDSQN